MNLEYAKMFQDSMKEYHKMLYEEHPYEFKQELEWNAKHHRYFFHSSSHSFILFGITHNDLFGWEAKLRDGFFEDFKKKSNQYASFEEYIKQTHVAEVPFLMQRIIDAYHQVNEKGE